MESNFAKSNDPTCELDSETLHQLFASGYGYDALIIGGRFESNKAGLKTLIKFLNFKLKIIKIFFIIIIF